MDMRRLRSRDQGGFTVAELGVTVAVMSVLLFSALSFLHSASRTVGVSATETENLDDARVTLARLENELRVAADVTQTASCPATETCLVVTVPLAAGGLEDVRYRYDSGTKKLYRATGDAVADTWGSEVAIVSNVVNGSEAVFCRSTACTTPSEVGATLIVLKINADADHPERVMQLQSYVSPRNG